MESKIAAEFAEESFNTHYFRGESAHHSSTNAQESVNDCSQIQLSKSSQPQKFPAFYVDIGAPRSIIGLRQLDLVLNHLRKPDIPFIKSHYSFRFGDVTVQSLGTIEIALENPSPWRPITAIMDVVPVDVPAFLGLDVLDAEQLHADNVTNRLVHCEVLSRKKDTLKYKDR